MVQILQFTPFWNWRPEYPPPPFRKTSDLGWPKFTPEYPPPQILENFRFGMTKVYSRIPPHFGKLQIWDDQSLLRNNPPPHFGKLQIWDDQSLLRNSPPPILENFRFEMTKVYSGIPPQFWKTSDLGWPKFTPEYPPISENFRFGMTKVYSGIPPQFGKLQIWDDQSLLRNTPPFRKTSDLGWPKFTPEYPPPPNENCQRVQVRDFQNTESYYMWRLYLTRITTSYICARKSKKEKIPYEWFISHISDSVSHLTLFHQQICLANQMDARARF